MKKMVFSAIALIAFSVNSMANNKIVREIINLKNTTIEQHVEEKDKKPCKFFIKGVDAHGRKFYTEYTVTSGNTTLRGCNNAAADKAEKLELQNSKVESVQVVWE